MAKVVVWSEIFFVEDNMVIHNGTTYRVNTFAHEYGHALGLRHHDGNNTLMRSSAPLLPYRQPLVRLNSDRRAASMDAAFAAFIIGRGTRP